MRTNRANLNYKTEVHLLRAFVNHYSFVTGLMGRLNGLSGGPEDCSIGVNVILNANIYEGYKVVDPMMFAPLAEAPYHNVLEGSLFQCCDLLSWIAGTYDAKELNEHNHKNQPTEFTIETWKAINEDEWQLKYKTIWKGVRWLDAAHTGDGGNRTCAGIATFVCDEKREVEVENGEIIKVEGEHPNIELRRILQQNLPDPKHCAGYMG